MGNNFVYASNGILSDEERKKKIDHYSNGYLFESCIDLSIGVTVTKKDWQDDSKENLAAAVAEFITFWRINYRDRLNGFAGVDSIKWIFK